MHEKIEDERPAARHLPQIGGKVEAQSHVTYESIDPGKDAERQQVVDLPSAARCIPAAFNTEVGADNDPLRGRRRLRLVQCRRASRRRAIARSTRSRIRSRRAGAKRDRRAPQDQIRRDARQAQGRHGVRRRSRIRRAQSPNRRQAQARRQAASRRVAAGDRGGVRTPKDASGSAEADSPTEWIVFRVTEIRHADSKPRSPRCKRDRRAVEEAAERRNSRSNIWLGCRTISASRINQAALEPGSAAARQN